MSIKKIVRLVKVDDANKIFSSMLMLKKICRTCRFNIMHLGFQ